jgi:carboxyl-terminal processing protease
MAFFKLRVFSLVVFLCFLVPLSVDTQEPDFGDDSETLAEVPADYQLSAMRIYNRTVLLAKEQYVDPQRFNPRKMLLGALNAIEQTVPEVVIGDVSDDKILVQVGSKFTTIPVDNMNSLWDLSFKLRDFFRFFEENLPKKTNLRDIEYAAVNGTLSKLDAHSNLLPPILSTEMHVRTNGEFGGLGVVIGVRDGFLTVIAPVEGTPAYKAGIKTKDRVIKIGEESTVNMDLNKAVSKLRGEPGTAAYLTIERPRESLPRKFKLIREIIKVESVTSQLLSKDVGYIKLKEFQKNSGADVTTMLADLKAKSGDKLKGLILDLRNNPGGLLEQSVAISDIFLDGGVVVVTQEGQADKREEKYATPGASKTELPLIVLVNGGSASASEIVAGALKNRKRALVMGEQTFGKGSVQLLYDFPDHSALKLTIAQYLTPGDESIQSVGITPDIELHPAYAKDLQTLSLFEKDFTREEDLDAHLDNKERIVSHKSSFEVSYLDIKLDAEENEKIAYTTKYREDFDIGLATRILKTTKGSSEKEMLDAAGTVIATVKKEEAAKLEAALKKLAIDWSAAPKKIENVKMSASIVKPANAKAGSDLEIKIEAKNTGSTPIHQLYGVTDSQSRFLGGREFIFGKLNPNQKRSFSVKIKLPKDAITRRDLLRIKFFGNGAEELASLNVPIEIEGLPRPVFAYSAFIDDSRLGNGDGYLEPGEQVDLVFQVKNIGKGDSKEPIILLKNDGGPEIFIDQGRKKLSSLKAGESTIDKLTFTVKEKAKVAKFQIFLYDADMGVFWKEKIEIPVRPAAPQLTKLSGRVVVMQDQEGLFEAPSLDTPIIAKLPTQIEGEQIVKVGDMVRVRFSPNLSGFVKESALKPSTKAATSKKVALAPVSVYKRTPPTIELANGLQRPIVAKERFHLDAKLLDTSALKDAYIFVNEQKVFYKQFDAKGPTDTKVETDLKLKPGVNIVTIVARKDENYDQRETITVFSESGDPLQKTKSVDN